MISTESMYSQNPRKIGTLGQSNLRRSFKQRISRRIAGFCGGIKALDIDKDIHEIEPYIRETTVRKDEFVRNLVDKGHEQCTVEEFHYVVKAMYRYAIKAKAEEPKEKKYKEDEKPLFKELPSQLEEVLNQFATKNQFSTLTRSIVETVVVMEVSSDKYCPCDISENIPKDCISTLEMEWSSAQHKSQTKSPVLSNVESAMFDHAASMYVLYHITSIKAKMGIPMLFPTDKIHMMQLKRKMNLVMTLLNVNVWNNGEQARKKVNSLIHEQIKDDVKAWAFDKILPMEVMFDLKSVINQTDDMVQIVNGAARILTHQASVSDYFIKLGVDYFKLTSIEVEKLVSSKAMSLMQEVDHYQVTYHREHKHILESSIVTMKLYFALRYFFGIIKDHVGHRDLFKTLISSYQSWFGQTVMFWLQTFRSECIKRMEKALEIEKDVVQVTSLVKHSNSSVDVTFCFDKIISEWNNINFNDADIALLGCTKITDTICDGATQYVERLYTILENNGYYDFIDNAQFDVTDQLCITLNNVVHVRKYLHELPKLLNFTSVCQSMSVKYEDEAVGEKVAKVLEKLIEDADNDMMLRCRTMIQNIVERMAVDMVKLTKIFTQKAPWKKSSMDPLIVYLGANLQVLREKMETMIFPFILEEIWYHLLVIFKNNVLKGEPPAYYSCLIEHLYSIKSYLLAEMDCNCIDDCEGYCNLLKYLKMQTMTTKQLALMYYTQLQLDHQENSAGKYSFLTISVAYKEEADNSVTIYGKICKAEGLPSIKRNNSIDPVVTVMIHPHLYHIETTIKPLYTTIKENTHNPVFEEEFEFREIRKDTITAEGTVIIFTVWHHKTFIPNDFIGEIVLPLNSLQKCSNADETSQRTVPLLQPSEPTSGPFVILKHRQKNDQEAAQIIKTRTVMAGWQYPTKLFTPFVKVIAKAKGTVMDKL